MTESSQQGRRGYGPFPEGAEPTAPISAQPPAETIPRQTVRGPGAAAPGNPSPASSHQVAAGHGPARPGDPAGTQPWVTSETPAGETPTSGAPTSGTPSSGAPYPGTPTGGTPSSGASYPGTPTGGTPSSGAPYPGTPSGPPYGSNPTIGGGYIPTSGGGFSPTSGSGYGPFQSSPAPDPFGERQEGWTETPYGFNAPPGRRIEPTPPPERSRLVLGILAGLVAGLLLFGTGGWFAGRATAPKATPATTEPAPAPTASGQLGVFEQNQVAINQPDFAGTGLTAISEGFLPYLSACSRPKANTGEKARVRCTLDGMSAIFVEYNSTADRDKARVKALGQAVDARTLTPGVAPAAERATPSGRTTGNYVEYAYRLTESGTTRTVSGMWWDDADTPVAGYLLAYWKEGLGEKWDPMRDLWSRYA
ncbi:hypothetical protein JIG36_19420 [Actinoplanes sp. LDG1-06]|uniref:Uncharacterized protein n=1 Tax=Paractinoplanes ovalisporus TaxID=2810368 RepID=A0ABS2AD36_9ACTN|nr:hypothetical protein [Actinoplanes ovalisporus]MBM2617730.1 hypothetical protein [Actinoplanes ovalisporus]